MPRRPSRPPPADDNDADTPRIGGAMDRPLRDDEYPDEADEDADFDTGTDPCPWCGQEIYTDGPWCPKCGKPLGTDETPRPTGLGLPGWLFIAIVTLCLLALVYTAIR